MGIHRGPNMEKGGLIFGYDSGHGVCDNHTSSRFYQGKPTTNTWNKDTHSYTSGNITATRNATPPVPPPLEVQGFEVYKLQSNDGGVNQGIMGTSNVVDGVGGNYVHSVYCFLESGTIVTVGQHWHPWDYGVEQNPPLGRWVRLSQTVTNAVDNYGNVANAYRTNGVAYFTAPQYELGSIVTPHVDGTRSSTESLIDLKRTTNIDVSNVSFNSTGQPTFDGTNDYIDIINYTQHQRSTGTIEAVVKLDTISGNRYIFGAGGTNTYGATRALRVNSGYWGVVTYGSGTEDWGTGVAASTTDWQHVAFGWDGTTVYFYINGVRSSTTRSGLVTPLGTTLRIGMPPWSVGSASDGQIAVIRHYSTVLTESEIKQNFNTYKKRFNI